MAILHWTITDMTSKKCEKLISEGVSGEIAGVTKVKTDGPSEKTKSGLEILSFPLSLSISTSVTPEGSSVILPV